MAYPQGSKITKANMISDFNSLVITARNNSIIWAVSEGAWSVPSGTTGDPFYPNNSIGTFVSGDADPLGSRTANSLSTASLAAKVNASNVYNSFINSANSASNIRTVRLIKWFNNNGTYENSWDYSRVGSMSGSYQTTVSSSTNPTQGTKIVAANLDTFVASIATSMNTIKAQGATFNEYYCHSSCHSSCHNARGRR
jgi:hypothetical protein